MPSATQFKPGTTFLLALFSFLGGGLSAFADSALVDSEMVDSALVDRKTTQWTLAKEKNGVQLYTQQIPGSEFQAIKASVIVSASAEAVEAALGNGEGCAPWRSMCKSSKVVEVVSDAERIIHMVLDLPWPISDRDIVMRSLTQIDEAAQTVTVALNSIDDAVPPQKQVRAQCNGEFVIKALEDNKLEINYTMHADLGGDLSADLVESRQVASTLEEMQALRELAQNYVATAQ